MTFKYTFMFALLCASSSLFAQGPGPCVGIEPCGVKTEVECATGGFTARGCLDANYITVCDPTSIVKCLNAGSEIKKLSTHVDAWTPALLGQSGSDQVCFKNSETICWGKRKCSECTEITNPLTGQTAWVCQSTGTYEVLASNTDFYMQGSCIGIDWES